jgi:hypothetical protein
VRTCIGSRDIAPKSGPGPLFLVHDDRQSVTFLFRLH